MKINGKEIKFAFTVKARIEIASMCKDGKFENLGLLTTGIDKDDLETNWSVAKIMQRAYEDRRAHFDHEYKPSYMEDADFEFLTNAEFTEMMNDVLKAMGEGQKVTVRGTPVKNAEEGTVETK